MTDTQTNDVPRTRKRKQSKAAGSHQHLQKLQGYIAQLDASIDEVKKFIQLVSDQQTPDESSAKKAVRGINRHFDSSLREMVLYQEALDAEKRQKLSELYDVIGMDLNVDAALTLARQGQTDKEAIVRALLPAGGSAS